MNRSLHFYNAENTAKVTPIHSCKVKGEFINTFGIVFTNHYLSKPSVFITNPFKNYSHIIISHCSESTDRCQDYILQKTWTPPRATP